MASTPNPLEQSELELIDAYWRAANYLSVGQIHLRANPLQEEPLRLEQVNPWLLGHWGTTPGLNLVYAHFNRLIKAHELDVMQVREPLSAG
jgi:xylulose-5-phosphate/fructose-6-phosphate phosphoketolase